MTGGRGESAQAKAYATGKAGLKIISAQDGTSAAAGFDGK
jgi:hypothetical protein